MLTPRGSLRTFLAPIPWSPSAQSVSRIPPDCLRVRRTGPTCGLMSFWRGTPESVARLPGRSRHQPAKITPMQQQKSQGTSTSKVSLQHFAAGVDQLVISGSAVNRPQSADGFSTWSITITSTGFLSISSFSPSCSCTAEEIEGPTGCCDCPPPPGGGAVLPFVSACYTLCKCKLFSTQTSISQMCNCAALVSKISLHTFGAQVQN